MRIRTIYTLTVAMLLLTVLASPVIAADQPVPNSAPGNNSVPISLPVSVMLQASPPPPLLLLAVQLVKPATSTTPAVFAVVSQVGIAQPVGPNMLKITIFNMLLNSATIGPALPQQPPPVAQPAGIPQK
jgi:hypothetical protein